MDRTRTIAQRVANGLGVPDALEAFGRRAAPADLTSVLLDVLRSVAGRANPTGILERHRVDRFVKPSPIGLPALRAAEDRLLSAIPDDFEQLVLAPLVPLGTHHVLGEVPQNNVISTVRRTELAADPTAGLALESASRRREILRTDPRSTSLVKLAAQQRITRAQTFEGPRSFAHFSLVGLVTAGRDTGSHDFEKAALTEHLTTAARAGLAAGADRLSLALTDFSERSQDVLDHATREASTGDRVAVEVDNQRTHARGYYQSVCFKVHATFGEETFEIGDGGFVDWNARLLGNAKERMLISALSVDRVALAMTGP